MLRKRFIRFAAFIMCAVCLLMSACTEDDGKVIARGRLSAKEYEAE